MDKRVEEIIASLEAISIKIVVPLRKKLLTKQHSVSFLD